MKEIEAKQTTRSPVRLEKDGRVAVVMIDNPPVNAGSWDVRKGLLEAIRAAAADPGASAIVIIGAGKTFVAGSAVIQL